ncbi:hypothetical protein [Pseudoalteromonas fuliginea]|uniref:Uncharacterized protein n=1 Tax=Pseudoalteromonas fuliginea TaxID=1872678 RepID=A0ABD3YBL2_9GAMM|nr:hypothetical protein [Pseudoalteromonas fuliginea]KDC52232.1 hypothetical protein DC53_05900 [Pseudoalteromonas fuliginea]KJZ23049.1 hypothetical protein TW82_19205 [Pseudoalteromonas fuliginea]
MYAQLEKPKENKSRVVTNSVVQKKTALLQLKKFTDEANTISSYARAMIPNSGNRTKEVIASNGKSYAGVALIHYLIDKDHAGSWENRTNLAKRATLAVDIKAANCNQFAALAYSEALRTTKADNVSLEYDAHHAYAVAYDNEDKAKPEEQTIIDPWVKTTGLRKDLQTYYKGREGHQKATTKADSGNWYYSQYTEELLKKYGRSVDDEIYNDTAKYGFDLAKEKEKEGAASF